MICLGVLLGALHAQVAQEAGRYSVDLSFLASIVPHDGPVLFGAELWQLLGVTLLLVGGLAAGWIASSILLRLFGRFFRGWHAMAETSPIVHTAVRPLAVVVGLTISRALLPGLSLASIPLQPILFAIDGLVVVASIIIAFRLSNLLWFRLRQKAAATESQLDDALVPLMEKATKFLIVLVGLIVLLQSWNFDVTAILAGVSIGGIALAFAAQSTISNLFGSAMIFVDRPFQIGDWIKVDGHDGTVESIGFRSTRIRTFANSVISIPNGKLADMAVDNMGLREMRRYQILLGVPYSTSADRIEAFVAELKSILLSHPATLKDEDQTLVAFHAFDASSLNVMVNTYFEVTTWRQEMEARHELNLAFLQAAERCGVQYAYPTRTLHVASMPSTTSTGMQGAS